MPAPLHTYRPWRLSCIAPLVGSAAFLIAAQSQSVLAKSPASSPASKPRPDFLKRAELGALRTLSGARAIRFSRYTGPEWSFGGSVGLASFSHREPNDEGAFKRVRFVGRLMLGAEAMHWPLKLQDPKDRRLRADLGFGARFAFYWGFTGDDGDDDKTLDTPLELGLEFPVAVRLFVGERIHLTPEFGLLLRYVPGSRKPDQNNDTDSNPGSGVGERLGTTNGPGFGVEFGDHAGMFVGLSLGYLFGE